MHKLVRRALPVVAAVTALGFAAANANASVYQSSAKQASYSTRGYTVHNDVWGNGPGPQTLWVNSAGNWGVHSTQPNTGGVKSYPNVSKSVGTAINSLHSATSSFSQSLPGTGNFESAYDIWLNGSRYEIMIWTHNHNVYPAGSRVRTVTLNNQSWTLWAGGNGYNPVYSFVLNGNEDSGSVNILAMLKYLEYTPKYFSNPTLSTIEYGFEISSTGNTQQNFTINSYSASTS